MIKKNRLKKIRLPETKSGICQRTFALLYGYLVDLRRRAGLSRDFVTRKIKYKGYTLLLLENKKQKKRELIHNFAKSSQQSLILFFFPKNETGGGIVKTMQSTKSTVMISIGLRM